jgi:hypothetical protein
MSSDLAPGQRVLAVVEMCCQHTLTAPLQQHSSTCHAAAQASNVRCLLNVNTWSSTHHRSCFSLDAALAAAVYAAAHGGNTFTAAGAWDDVEIAATQLPAVTVQQLITQNPDHVIQFIAKKGVVKLGEFKVQVRQKEAISDLAQLLHMANCTYVVQRFSWRPSWQRTHMLRSFRWSRRNTPPPLGLCALSLLRRTPRQCVFLLVLRNNHNTTKEMHHSVVGDGGGGCDMTSQQFATCDQSCAAC